ncbi:MAG: hypothetical protein VR67_08820 [Peptococcaceae bacterium BRH_c8a]|nr:MAG: hypothetical protein VR67_08820 [Peptococcaceae bacterium BRH_c8a]
MKRKHLIWILVLMLMLLVNTAAFAADDTPPLLPAFYDGDVVYANGTPVESGLIRAYIGGIQASLDEDPNSQINNGSYMDFLVNGDYPQWDSPVAFKVLIGNTEYEAIPNEQVLWRSGSIKIVNLTVQTDSPGPVVNPPSVQTNAASNVTENSAKLNGSIINNGGAPVTEYGFMWGTDQSTLATKPVGNTDATGTFEISLGSLEPDTTYYYKAYATNSEDTGYGDPQSFKTQESINIISASISIPSVKGQPEDVVQVPVNFTSTGGVAGVQFEIDFDNQLLTYQGVEAGDLVQGFNVSGNQINDSVTRIIVNTMDGGTIPGGTGVITNLNFQVNDATQSGQSCALEFSSIEATDADGSIVTDFTSTNGSFEVASLIKGDANGDGKVTVSDVVQTVNFALGKSTPSPEELLAVDMNGDGRISVADVVAIVNIALGKTN